METGYTSTPSPVNIGRWISEGWNLINQDLGFYVVLTLVFLAISIAAGSTVLGIVLIGPLQAGYYYILFRKLQGQSVSIGDIGKGFDVFVSAMLMGIVVAAFTTFGFILCILPGFVVMAWYIFAPAFVMEQKLDFWQAMEKSRLLVRNHLFEFIMFIIVQILLILVGIICCLVGVLIAVPLCMAATAVAYRDMVGLAQETAA
jgi:uncharacterized membrane protein